MQDQKEVEFQTWQNFHKAQLESLGVPEALHRILFVKLRYEEDDHAKFFEIVEDESLGRKVRAKEDLKKDD